MLAICTIWPILPARPAMENTLSINADIEGAETLKLFAIYCPNKKTVEELTGEQIYACEKLNEFNNQIGRLNATLQDNIVLRDYYQGLALPGFQEEEPEEEPEEEKDEEKEA